MAQVNRSTIKSYFQRKSKPTQQEFEDFIDSAVLVGDPIDTFIQKANLAEAQAGIDDTKVMTPLRVKDSIEFNTRLGSLPNLLSDVTSEITMAINNLLNGAGSAYDTLKEIENELLDNDSAIASIISDIATKVSLTGNQTIAGIKTFSSTPILNSGIIQIGSTAGTKVFIRFDGKISSDGTTWVDIAKDSDFFNNVGEFLTSLTATGAAGNIDSLPNITYVAENGVSNSVVVIPRNTNPTGRGTYSDWNKIGGGRSDLINHAEGGSGGFDLWTKNSADGTDQPTRIVTINQNGEMFIDPDGNNYTNIHSGNIANYTGEAPGDIKQVRESDLPISGWSKLIGTELGTFIGGSDSLNSQDSNFTSGHSWNMVAGSGSNTAEVITIQGRLRLVANVDSPDPYGELLISLDANKSYNLDFNVEYHFGSNLPNVSISLRRQTDNDVTTIISDIADGFTGPASQIFTPPTTDSYYLTVKLDKTSSTNIGQVRLDFLQIRESVNIVSIIKD